MNNMEELILRATESKIGICIHTDNMEQTKRQFYSVKRKMLDTGTLAVDSISCRTSPDNKNHFWLIKKGPTDGS